MGYEVCGWERVGGGGVRRGVRVGWVEWVVWGELLGWVVRGVREWVMKGVIEKGYEKGCEKCESVRYEECVRKACMRTCGARGQLGRTER